MKIKKIDKISKNNIETKYKIFIIISMILMWFFVFKFKYVLLDKLNLKVIFLPILVLVTLVIHEYLHIIIYKFFGGPKAEIEVKRDKELGAIIIYQKNKDIFYKKIEYIILLLTPLVIITIISLVAISISNINTELIKLNMLLNIMGSSTDIVVSVKLLFSKKAKYINLDYDEKEGVILNLYNKKV